MATKSRSFLSRVSPTQWVALLLTVLAVLFVFDNRATVTVEFLLISVQSPMWLILLVMFVLGWIIGVLMMRKRRH
ncbi:LapA family protein [Nocardia lijiangensis]|uniref:LapA family protein n=1 Tax=Nocardia lijiangensis TaxID=299618 RepID=UPI000A63EEA9|nr:LapA family protein [Nocardia lijiangensis]